MILNYCYDYNGDVTCDQNILLTKFLCFFLINSKLSSFFLKQVVTNNYGQTIFYF